MNFNQNNANKGKRTKPPPMRFKIMERLRYRDTPYEIIFAFRTVDEPHEWIYVLRELTPLVMTEARAVLDEVLITQANGEKDSQPRVEYSLVQSHYDAVKLYGKIPPRPGYRGDTAAVSNKTLLNEAKPY